MKHKDREWQIQEIENTSVLIELLARPNHNLSCGFRVGNVIYLNDSQLTNQADDYAVIRVESETPYEWHGTRIEQISVRGILKEKIKEIVNKCADPAIQEKYTNELWARPVVIKKHSLVDICEQCSAVLKK